MRSDIVVSDIVASLCGHDKGALMMVVGLEGEDCVLLSDGRLRKIEKPKRKKRKHAQLAEFPDTRVAEKIRSGEKITNSELRKTLAQYSEEGNPDQEG